MRGLWQPFSNGHHEFSMSHISANNIDRKLIIVSMSMFSESRNPNVAIILVSIERVKMFIVQLSDRIN